MVAGAAVTRGVRAGALVCASLVVACGSTSPASGGAATAPVRVECEGSHAPLPDGVVTVRSEMADLAAMSGRALHVEPSAAPYMICAEMTIGPLPTDDATAAIELVRAQLGRSEFVLRVTEADLFLSRDAATDPAGCYCARE